MPLYVCMCAYEGDGLILLSPPRAQDGFSSALEELVKLQLVLFSLRFVWVSSGTINIDNCQLLWSICATENKKTYLKPSQHAKLF